MVMKIIKRLPLPFYVLSIISFLQVHAELLAQEAQYMVFFADKDSTAYSPERPLEFLSERAVTRKSRLQIPITYGDIPVSSTYLTQLKDAGAEVYYTTRWMNGALVQLSPEELAQVIQLPFVTSHELVKPVGRSDSRKAGSSYGESSAVHKKVSDEKSLLNEGQNNMLGIQTMHEKGFNGEGMLVAVFDGGFRGVDTVSYFRHIYEDNRMLPGYDFVGNSTNVHQYGQHGTEALSCIGAYRPGELEAGAYGADFMLCITEESVSEYRIEEYNWLFAAEMADSAGADIISTSLGYTTFDDSAMNYTYEDMDGQTAAITRAVNEATERGILCVISAGNEGNSGWHYVSPPADAPNVLAVGAVSSSRDKVSFSSFGPTSDGRIKPDVSAQGLQTIVVNSSGRVSRSNGTSFAAPLIAGFAAGVWQAFPNESNIQIMDRIRQGSDKALMPDNETGYGIPDFSRLYENYLTPNQEYRLNQRYRVFPNPVERSRLFIEANEGLLQGPLTVVMYSSTGRQVLRKDFENPDSASLSLEIDHLSQGIYVMHILSASASDTLKIVKF